VITSQAHETINFFEKVHQTYMKTAGGARP
jgi:hypothetical protein